MKVTLIIIVVVFWDIWLGRFENIVESRLIHERVSYTGKYFTPMHCVIKRVYCSLLLYDYPIVYPTSAFLSENFTFSF